jgi:1-acyl-sn-glycerol-3-phosphate acyltransferase
MGWRISGDIPDVPKMVLIVAPHSSNWDFVVGVAAKVALRLRIKYLAKDALFRFPLGIIMRQFGGIPVHRSSSNAVVQSILTEFEQHTQLVLAIAPEGTRTRVDRWRTGFYHIAKAARVPIVPVALNWHTRTIEIQGPFVPGDDADDDIAALRGRFTAARRRDELD